MAIRRKKQSGILFLVILVSIATLLLPSIDIHGFKNRDYPKLITNSPLACFTNNPPMPENSRAAYRSPPSSASPVPLSETNPPDSSPYCASGTSGKFHSAGCAYAQNIKPENILHFSTREEAIAMGYEPCKRCCP